MDVYKGNDEGQGVGVSRQADEPYALVRNYAHSISEVDNEKRVIRPTAAVP